MSFRFVPLEIPDVLRVEPTVHRDDRGFFLESWRRSAFREGGIDVEFVQDNRARSTRGVLRGLHYQLPPAAQGKLVGVSRGEVFDVAVDLRRGSPTFGGWVGIRLTEEDHDMLWVPPGFAHGYCVLSEVAEVAYKVTAEYAPALDRGIRWDDPEVGVEWPVAEPVLSEKDRALPLLADAEVPYGAEG